MFPFLSFGQAASTKFTPVTSVFRKETPSRFAEENQTRSGAVEPDPLEADRDPRPPGEDAALGALREAEEGEAPQRGCLLEGGRAREIGVPEVGPVSERRPVERRPALEPRTFK